MRPGAGIVRAAGTTLVDAAIYEERAGPIDPGGMLDVGGRDAFTARAVRSRAEMTDHVAQLTQLHFAERVGFALVFGSLIGIERQWRQRMAGLRTNALVAVGAALFVMNAPLLGNPENATQIAAYVVSGIGFLAGGVIFKERLSVSGLNTAATLWCTAAIGVLTGFGFIVDAAVGVAAVLFVHVIMRPVVGLVNRRPLDESDLVTSYEVHATCSAELEERVRATLVAAIRRTRMSLTAVYSDDAPNGHVEIVADVTVRGTGDARLERVVSELGLIPAVIASSWRQVPLTAEESELSTGE